LTFPVSIAEIKNLKAEKSKLKMHSWFLNLFMAHVLSFDIQMKRFALYLSGNDGHGSLNLYYKVLKIATGAGNDGLNQFCGSCLCLSL
jgi:hypothetical protein